LYYIKELCVKLVTYQKICLSLNTILWNTVEVNTHTCCEHDFNL